MKLSTVAFLAVSVLGTTLGNSSVVAASFGLSDPDSCREDAMEMAPDDISALFIGKSVEECRVLYEHSAARCQGTAIKRGLNGAAVRCAKSAMEREFDRQQLKKPLDEVTANRSIQDLYVKAVDAFCLPFETRAQSSGSYDEDTFCHFSLWSFRADELARFKKLAPAFADAKPKRFSTKAFEPFARMQCRHWLTHHKIQTTADVCFNGVLSEIESIVSDPEVFNPK